MDLTYFPSIILSFLQVNYRDSSIKTFITVIKRVLKGINGNDHFDLKTLLDYTTVKNFLETVPNIDVRRNMANTIAAIIKAGGYSESYYDKYIKLRDVYSKEGKIKVIPRNITSNVITLEDVAQKAAKYANSNKYRDRLKNICLLLYSLVPALRLEDWTSLRVNRASSSKSIDTNLENYINLTTGTVSFTHYKTSDSHGLRTFKLPSTVIKALKEWVTLSNGDYLLTKEDGSKLETNDLLYILKAEGLSASELRKTYISESVPDMTMKQRHKLANIMGHSIETQEFTYRHHDEPIPRSSPTFHAQMRVREAEMSI